MTGRRWTKRLRLLFPVAACVAAITGAACTTNDSSSPTTPSSSTPGPGSPAPPTAGSVQIAINPNPVPFSGTPITSVASCSALPNTWFYDQILRETGGVAVTFTSRIDKFDGRVVNSLTGLSLLVPANDSLTISTRWCSGQGVAHTAQSTFSGADAMGRAMTIEGPVVNLQSP